MAKITRNRMCSDPWLPNIVNDPVIRQCRGNHLPSSSTATTSSASTPAAASAATTTSVSTHFLQLIGNVLIGFLEHSDQISSTFCIVGGKQGDGSSASSCTTSSSNSVNIVLGVVREIVIDDMCNILNICES